MLGIKHSISRSTFQDADWARLPAALILSSVLWLQVTDLQRLVLVAEPTPLRFHRAVPEPGEDQLPPPSGPLVEPPLSGFRGAAAGEQQRPACRHPEVLTWGPETKRVTGTTWEWDSLKTPFYICPTMHCSQSTCEHLQLGHQLLVAAILSVVRVVKLQQAQSGPE